MTHHSVQELLEGMADEITSVTDLLLSVETSMGLHRLASTSEKAQQFDLAMQILNDLARLARRIGEGLSEAQVPASIVQEGDLLLERSRIRLLRAGDPASAGPIEQVELF